MRDGREELPLRLLHLVQLARHRVERACERPDLVAALDRDGLAKRARGDLGRRRGQQGERAGHPLGDGGRGEQRQAHRGAERNQHGGPRAHLEACGLGLRREDLRVGRRHQRVEALLDLLGEPPRIRVDQTQRAGALASPEERLLLGDDAPVSLERHARLAEVKRLPVAVRVLGEADEILRNPRRSLGPRRHVARVAQHRGARLEPHERRHRLAGGRGEAQRRNGAGRDLTVDGHETIHREEAETTDAREHDDHERGGQEDFRA